MMRASPARFRVEGSGFGANVEALVSGIGFWGRMIMYYSDTE